MLKRFGLYAPVALIAFALLCGCAQQPAAAPQSATTAPQSILVDSAPASRSTVTGPVNELKLHFSPPARLGEVTVTGPNGTMPMMITAVGEVRYYSVPLPGLAAGSYTVAWRATAAGHDYQGSFGFSVR